MKSGRLTAAVVTCSVVGAMGLAIVTPRVALAACGVGALCLLFRPLCRPFLVGFVLAALVSMATASLFIPTEIVVTNLSNRPMDPGLRSFGDRHHSAYEQAVRRTAVITVVGGLLGGAIGAVVSPYLRPRLDRVLAIRGFATLVRAARLLALGGVAATVFAASLARASSDWLPLIWIGLFTTLLGTIAIMWWAQRSRASRPNDAGTTAGPT